MGVGEVLKEDYYYNEHDVNQVDKLYKKKKKKKLKRKVKILCFLLFLLMIAGYFVSDLSKVKSIKIIGNKEVSSKLIKEASSITKDSIYLFIDKDKSADNIKKLALVKKADISYDIFGNITIEIEESNKVAYATIENKTYVIDELGKVVETKDENIKETLKSCPKLVHFDSLDLLKQFAKEYANVPELIKTKTSDIIYSPQPSDETRVEYILDNGKKLIVRIENMADELTRFPFEAHMIQNPNACEFNFYGKNIYLTKCPEEADVGENKVEEVTEE